MLKMLKKATILFLLCFNFTFAQATASPDICVALNSLNIYKSNNLKIFQAYLKSFFPGEGVTGKNDLSTKYYTKQFQISYGLNPSGYIDFQTINFIKNTEKCFSLENKFLDIGTTTKKKSKISTTTGFVSAKSIDVTIKDQSQIINDLLKIFNLFGNDNNYVATDTTPAVTVKSLYQ